MAKIVVSSEFANRMERFDPDAELGWQNTNERTYDWQQSIKNNIEASGEKIAQLYPPKAYKDWVKGGEEEFEGVRMVLSPVVVPLMMVTAPLRAAKNAVLDTIVNAGVAAYHKLTGRNAVSAGADAVE